MTSLADELTLVTIGYNSANVIPSHIDSMVRSASSPLPRWIYVDNASTDATDSLLASYGNYIELIKNPENLGFGSACNIGIQAAKTRFVLILNPDTQLSEKDVQILLDKAKEMKAAIAGPATKAEIDNRVEYVSSLSGAAMLFDKSLMDEVGYFDERFFLYREDVDICKRACDAGKHVLYVGSARIAHVGGGSTDRNIEVLKFVNYHKGRSYILFARKHGFSQEKIDKYLKKNRWRMFVGLITFGRKRYLRAKSKLAGAASVL
jgi:N-acetylglucosaminyl-diphospho-decaprenol L-rhamnosyltransferase